MNQVQLDPRGGVPEPQKQVRIILKSADGKNLGSMGFGPPLVESISSLVAQARMMQGVGPSVFVSNTPEDAVSFFTIVGWDASRRELTAQLK